MEKNTWINIVDFDARQLDEVLLDVIRVAQPFENGDEASRDQTEQGFERMRVELGIHHELLLSVQVELGGARSHRWERAFRTEDGVCFARSCDEDVDHKMDTSLNE